MYVYIHKCNDKCLIYLLSTKTRGKQYICNIGNIYHRPF